MYLSENEMKLVLSQEYFSKSFTHSKIKYAMYRGKVNTDVHTLRFNFTTDINNEFVFQKSIKYLLLEYAPNTVLTASVDFDLLLYEPKMQSYYIWRANSNSVNFNENNEMQLRLTYENLSEFVSNAMQMNHPSLDIYFKNSNVTIDRPIAVVFSFFKL